MRKFTLFIVVVLLGFSAEAQFVQFYQGSAHTQPYQQLTNGTKINAIPGNPGSYLLSVDGPWTFFNEQTNNDTLIIGASGFIVTTGPKYSMAFDPFLARMAEKSNGTSGIYLEMDTLSTPKRMSVEWRDMQLVGNPATDVANFRINFYTNQVVEFHYGNSVVTDTTALNGENGPTVVHTLLSRDFTGAYEIHFVKGDPTSPVFATGNNGGALDTVPDSGTLYRFEPYNISVAEIEQGEFSVYPNPVQDVLMLEGTDQSTALVLDSSGKPVRHFPVKEKQANLSELASGLYFIQLKSPAGRVQLMRIQKQ